MCKDVFLQRTRLSPLACNGFRQAYIATTKDLKSKGVQVHSKYNLMYLAKSVAVCRTGFDKFQCLSIVADEARCSNAQLMMCFVSTPITDDTPTDTSRPPQVNVDIHIDLDERAIPVRIKEVLDKVNQKSVTKPHADDLVPTWHVCQCLDNALSSSMGMGLLSFKARGDQEPLQLRMARSGGCSGRYSWVPGKNGRGRWQVSYMTDEGECHKWLFSSPEQTPTPSVDNVTLACMDSVFAEIVASVDVA